MEHEFWHTRWAKGEIGFHEGRVNQYLQEHWPRVADAGPEPVFVPLCGKAQDMWWLHEQGHPLLGVELNEDACRAFFTEAGKALDTGAGPWSGASDDQRFRRFCHGQLQLWCGDFFQLRAEDLSQVRLVYDRAALIALPPLQRADYVSHLNAILPPRTRMLLVTLDYEEGKIKGPPFNVSDAEVQRLFGRDYRIEKILDNRLTPDHPFAKRRGLEQAVEGVFLLQKSAGAGTAD